ncbi:hypothetical protein [Xanthomonas oryzae]|uniref:hypothetical protein n=1 Tax=Xanthomonas oryzae TaxID=347 RepID=UPI000B12AA49|nr:hypothetical protein [Xanthomonas oryzae]
MTVDTYERVDLTGPRAGFGFQGHRFFTPENYDIEPCGMPANAYCHQVSGKAQR